MNTKDFASQDEAMAFAETLKADHAVDGFVQPDGTYRVSWIKNKKYTEYGTGAEHIDEVWVKEDGTMIVCQDIDHAHAINIIRMLLRNQRHRIMIEEEIIAQLQEAMEFASDDIDADTKPVLH